MIPLVSLSHLSSGLAPTLLHPKILKRVSWKSQDKGDPSIPTIRVQPKLLLEMLLGAGAGGGGEVSAGLDSWLLAPPPILRSWLPHLARSVGTDPWAGTS